MILDLTKDMNTVINLKPGDKCLVQKWFGLLRCPVCFKSDHLYTERSQLYPTEVEGIYFCHKAHRFFIKDLNLGTRLENYTLDDVFSNRFRMFLHKIIKLFRIVK